jgi:hypothetical protein
LIEAYQYLLDHQLQWYTRNEPARWAKGRRQALVQTTRGWRLTIAERKRILLDNIYGVDIDPQAVEVTKLSLLLKVLEGETDQTLQPLLFGLHERALPDLGKNIKCGNSLVGLGFSETGSLDKKRRSANTPPFPYQPSLLELTDEEKRDLNNFDWNREFPSICKAGGFDAVIGNPPYLYSAGQEYEGYFSSHFQFSEYQTDFYVYFLERGLGLLGDTGWLGMIVSDSWLKGKYFKVLRQHLLQKTAIQQVVVFGYPPFGAAAIENSILTLTKESPRKQFEVSKFTEPRILHKLNNLNPQQCLARGLIDIHSDPDSERVLTKLEHGSQPLSSFCRLNRGVHAYRTDGYGKSAFRAGPQTKRDKDEQVYHANKKVNDTYFRELKGKHLQRYHYTWDGTYISYGDWLAESRSPEFFMQPKLAIRKIIARRLICAWVPKPTVLDQSIYVVIAKPGAKVSLLYLLGILSSSIGGWYLQRKHSIYDTLYPWFPKEHLANFPIRPIEFTRAPSKSLHDRIVSAVEQMLTLHGQLDHANTPQEKTSLKRQIDAKDSQIDRLVYDLYGLTQSDIEIIEADLQSLG